MLNWHDLKLHSDAFYYDFLILRSVFNYVYIHYGTLLTKHDRMQSCTCIRTHTHPNTPEKHNYIHFCGGLMGGEKNVQRNTLTMHRHAPAIRIFVQHIRTILPSALMTTTTWTLRVHLHHFDRHNAAPQCVFFALPARVHAHSEFDAHCAGLLCCSLGERIHLACAVVRFSAYYMNAYWTVGNYRRAGSGSQLSRIFDGAQCAASAYSHAHQHEATNMYTRLLNFAHACIHHKCVPVCYFSSVQCNKCALNWN